MLSVRLPLVLASACIPYVSACGGESQKDPKFGPDPICEDGVGAGQWKLLEGPLYGSRPLHTDGQDIFISSIDAEKAPLCRAYVQFNPLSGSQTVLKPPGCPEAIASTSAPTHFAVTASYLFSAGAISGRDDSVLFDRNTSEWSEPKRPSDYGSRVGPSIVVSNEAFLVWGGTLDPSVHDKEFTHLFASPRLDGYRFDPTSGDWTSFAAMKGESDFLPELTFGRDEEDDLIVVGYEAGSTRAEPKNRVFVHSNSTDSWRELSLKKGPPGRLRPSVAVVGNEIFLAGGVVDPGNGRAHQEFHDLWRIDIASGESQQIEAPSWSDPKSVFELGNQVWVVGACKTTALFDSSNNRWQKVTSKGSLAEQDLGFWDAIAVGSRLVVGPGEGEKATTVYAVLDP